MAKHESPIETWKSMEIVEIVFPDGSCYSVNSQSDLGGYCKKITTYFERAAMSTVVWFDVELNHAADVRIPGHALMRIHYRKVN